MNRSCVAVFLVAVVAVVAASAVADEPAAKVLIGQSFDLLANENPKAPKVGTYRIHATEKQGRIGVLESITLEVRGKKIGMLSQVEYRRNNEGALIATSGSAETSVNNKVVMLADFTITNRKLTYTATLLNSKNDPELPQPVQRTIDLPEGVVLLSSARAVIGPMLQPKPGERPIVWIEFPDDIDEAINVKEGFSLGRNATDDGGYTIHVRKGNRDLGPLPFDAKGRIKAHKLFGKYPMREQDIGA